MTDEKPLNELPERNVTDHFRDAIVIMAGIIPFPVSDILDRFLPSSLAKRQQEWQKRVAQGLVILQEQFNIMPETLTKNEVFTTALRLFQRNSRSHSERGNTNKPFLDRRP